MKCKKTIFKEIMILLSLCLLVPVLSACGEKNGGNNQPASVSPDEPKTEASADLPLASVYPAFNQARQLTVSAIEMGWTGPQENLDIVTPELQKRTNMKFVYEPITVSTYDDMNQKLNLMIASKDIPDVYMGLQDSYTMEIFQRLGTNDLIWDIAPLIEKYANIYGLVKPELEMYKEPSGASYFVPAQTGRGNDIMHSPPGGLHFRTDFLEILGMEWPTTPEELYTYLTRCRDEIGESGGKAILPISFGENLSGIHWTLLTPFFTETLATDIQGFAYDTTDNFKVVNQEFSNSEQMMRACKFINKLYQEKLLDNEILTHKDAQFREKASAGNVACLPGNWWDVNAFTDAARSNVPELEYVYSRIYDKANIPAEKYEKNWTNAISMYSTLILSKKLDLDTVEHFLSVLDYMATMEGQLLIQMGIEGVSYEMDQNGKAKFTDQFKADTDDLDWNQQAAFGVAYLQQFVYNFPAYESVIDEYPALLREDNQKSWANDFHRQKYDPQMMPTKDYYFVAGPVESRQINAIYDARDTLLVNVLLAADEAEVERLVNEYDEQCKRLGIEDIIEERQAFIDQLNIE